MQRSQYNQRYSDETTDPQKGGERLFNRQSSFPSLSDKKR